MATKMAAITSRDAQEISTLERPKGRLKLAERLHWESVDEDDDTQRSILLDYYYDCLMFCVKKGFPWSQTCSLFTVATQMSQECAGKSLGDAVKSYKTVCQACADTVSEQNHKIFTDFFFSTFMTHYKLFQYVFSQQQERMVVRLDLPINTPIEPLPFKDSKGIATWEYERKLKQIGEDEEQKITRREEELLQNNVHDKEALQQTYENLEQAETPLERESLIEIIQGIANAHVTAASHAIQNSIEEGMDGLDFMVQKTILPRPQEMGAPQKYRTKMPLSGSKGPKSKPDKNTAQNSRSTSSKTGKGK